MDKIEYKLKDNPKVLDISYSDENIEYFGAKMYSFKNEWLYDFATEEEKECFDKQNDIMQDYANKRDTFEYLGTIYYKGEIVELYDNGDEIIQYYPNEEKGNSYSLTMVVITHRKGLVQ